MVLRNVTEITSVTKNSAALTEPIVYRGVVSYLQELLILHEPYLSLAFVCMPQGNPYLQNRGEALSLFHALPALRHTCSASASCRPRV